MGEALLMLSEGRYIVGKWGVDRQLTRRPNRTLRCDPGEEEEGGVGLGMEIGVVQAHGSGVDT